MAPKETSRTYDATPADAYAAVERAVTRVGMKVKHTDPERGVVEATTGVTIWSWGERVTASVTEAGPGSVTVTIAIALKFQVFGWGHQQRVADGLLDEVARQLSGKTLG